MLNWEKMPFLRKESTRMELSEAEERKELIEIYKSSLVVKMLDLQEKRGDETIAIFTDIDHTFYKKGRETAANELRAEGLKRDYPFVAVTGNSYEGILKRIELGELPYFEAIVGSVGTEVWVLHEENEKKEYKKDCFYEASLRKLGFERQKIVERAQKMIDEFRENSSQLELDFQNRVQEQELLVHPDLPREPFKVSCYFFSESGDLEQVTKKVAEHFSDQRVLVCEEIGYNSTLAPNEVRKKYCLDILPATKADAVNYLTKILGIKSGVVAGDSGNDVEMLLETGKLNAILVGGYKPEALAGVAKAEVIRKGAGSFQKIRTSGGEVKAVYVEKDSTRQAAESILRAGKVLERARRIFRNDKK